MYIQFDPTRVTFQRVKLRRAVEALGGSVTVLDEAHFKRTGQEEFHRIAAPMAVVRTFLIRNNRPKFVHPMEAALVYYGERVIGIELAPAHQKNERKLVGGVTGETREWTITAETNFKRLLEPSMFRGEWFFDGIYAYRFPTTNLVREVLHGNPLTSDGQFREVPCRALNMTYLSSAKVISDQLRRKKAAYNEDGRIEQEGRACLAYVVNDEQFVVSPPIWKSLTSVGSSTVASDIDDDDDDAGGDASSNFGSLDRLFFVNLMFGLTAAKEISDAFGYASIAPLQLPELMLQLKTVNLPKVVQQVRATHDIGMPVTVCIAWLMGLLHRAETDDQVNVVRRMMKYLLKRGKYERSKLSEKTLLRSDELARPIELIPASKALDNFNNMPKDAWRRIQSDFEVAGIESGSQRIRQRDALAVEDD